MQKAFRPVSSVTLLDTTPAADLHSAYQYLHLNNIPCKHNPYPFRIFTVKNKSTLNLGCIFVVISRNSYTD